MIKKYFVLSGGGSRGFAHLGALKAFSEQGIYPAEIAGTSAGAFAGLFLANGFTPDEIKELLIKNLKTNILGWNGFRMGLISMKNIREFLVKNLRYTKFEDMPIPLHVTTTDFESGRQYIFNTGEVIDVVIAACSIPVIFPPVFINGIPHVDGGLSNNLPVEPFIDKKNEVISIYVNPIKPFNPKESFAEMMDRAIHLSFREMVGRSAKDCYMNIEPPDLNKFGLFDINKFPEIFDTGYKFTKELLQKKSLNAN